MCTDFLEWFQCGHSRSFQLKYCRQVFCKFSRCPKDRRQTVKDEKHYLGPFCPDCRRQRERAHKTPQQHSVGSSTPNPRPRNPKAPTPPHKRNRHQQAPHESNRHQQAGIPKAPAVPPRNASRQDKTSHRKADTNTGKVENTDEMIKKLKAAELEMRRSDEQEYKKRQHSEVMKEKERQRRKAEEREKQKERDRRLEAELQKELEEERKEFKKKEAERERKRKEHQIDFERKRREHEINPEQKRKGNEKEAERKRKENKKEAERKRKEEKESERNRKKEKEAKRNMMEKENQEAKEEARSKAMNFYDKDYSRSAAAASLRSAMYYADDEPSFEPGATPKRKKAKAEPRLPLGRTPTARTHGKAL